MPTEDWFARTTVATPRPCTLIGARQIQAWERPLEHSCAAVRQPLPSSRSWPCRCLTAPAAAGVARRSERSGDRGHDRSTSHNAACLHLHTIDMDVPISSTAGQYHALWVSMKARSPSADGVTASSVQRVRAMREKTGRRGRRPEQHGALAWRRHGRGAITPTRSNGFATTASRLNWPASWARSAADMAFRASHPSNHNAPRVRSVHRISSSDEDAREDSDERPHLLLPVAQGHTPPSEPEARESRSLGLSPRFALAAGSWSCARPAAHAPRCHYSDHSTSPRLME